MKANRSTAERSARTMADLDIQIAVESDGWASEADLAGIANRVLTTAAACLAEREGQPFPPHAVEVSLVFTEDEAMRAINAEWRGKDKPTNVLSFPAFPIGPGDKPGPMLGDIVLARETIAREAQELEKSFDEHLTHLLVHGFLHLFGYDHIEAEDAEQMERLETGILAELGLSDPYAGQDPI